MDSKIDILSVSSASNVHSVDLGRYLITISSNYSGPEGSIKQFIIIY